MKPFTLHTGIVAPLDRANVDTDQIIPKQFLKKIERSGYKKHLFQDWRYLDKEGQTENPDFVLNKPAYRQATILLARENFGSGSSREHALWALNDFGFRAVVAPTFADIFHNNCFQNSILPIKLPSKVIDALFEVVDQNPGLKVSIDLNEQRIYFSSDSEIKFNNDQFESIKQLESALSFTIDPFKKEFLLKGMDQIDWTLQYASLISEYESNTQKEKPWLSTIQV